MLLLSLLLFLLAAAPPHDASQALTPKPWPCRPLQVCAELPDPVTQPRLYAIVTTCMLHGPCGDANPSMKCMAEGVCTKKYPKPFQPHTMIPTDGFPVYQRRENGRCFVITRSVHVVHALPNMFLRPAPPCVGSNSLYRFYYFYFVFSHLFHPRAGMASPSPLTTDGSSHTTPTWR